MFMPERYNTQLRSQNANNIKFRIYIYTSSNEILSYFGIKDIWKENPPKSNLHVVVKIEVVALNSKIT
ncbi:unnamed protein product [Rhizophagus irregularis]|uniref:Uncharacterized protein n=1 Tax=Rhizophagus irregularis TaxID=588596 RepID=A0A915YY99_9GLOM|nr:unnamed protein product [Rhizophagus irregularis]